jgi:hypothetical protein
MAVNTRDTEQMRRLRPALLDLIKPQTSDKALGWIHLHLATSAYVEGELEQALEHASLSADKARAIGHEYLLATAVQSRLMASWARDGVLPQPMLADMVDLIRRTGVKTDAAVALWFVARYAAAVEPERAGGWLAHAQRILVELDGDIWPESNLRDETMAVLGLVDLAQLLADTPPLDHTSALEHANAWLRSRDPDEAARAEPEPNLLAPANADR